MNKEPIGLYIFRFVSGFALLFFMCMLYWSSVLVENQLRALTADVGQLKNDLFGLRAETDRIRSDVLQAIVDEGRQRQQTYLPPPPSGAEESGALVPMSILNHPKTAAAGAKSEAAYENLLKPDPFYNETLPKLLGADFAPKHTFHTASLGKPDNLHPFSNWRQVSTWNGLCSVSVAKQMFGKYETLSPDMALRVEERPDPATGLTEHWVFLRDGVYWQPLKPELFAGQVKLASHFLRKHQVTADDFKFYFDALMNPYVQEPQAVSLRTYYNTVKEIEVVDKLTFVVRWKGDDAPGAKGKLKYIARLLTGQLKPLPSFVYKYFADGRKIVEDDGAADTYRTNSAWAQNFTQHWAKNVIVSCGPWVFEGMTDRQITFKRNSDFYFPLAALAARWEIDLKDSMDTFWQEFKNNHLDSYELPPDQALELQDFLGSAQYAQQAQQGSAVKRLDYVLRSYSYIAWNQARPFFASKKVRQALTMAIDRQRIIRQNLNGMGIEINGTFYRYSPSYDASITPWPFDPQQARRLLEEEGWYDSDGDGVIDKDIDGKRVPFRFSLTYFVKNPTTKAVCEYVATALKEVGIACSLRGVDLADLSSVFDDKNFDALALAWMLGTPPEDPRQVWYSAGAKEKGSSNAIGFANAQADKIIDALDYEYDPERRIALYHQFDAIIHEEQPYTFLYTPKVALLYREYLQNVFIPSERQDLVPGANVSEPEPEIYWIKRDHG